MALVFDIDMIDDPIVNSIIYNNSDKNNEVRGCTLAPSANSSRSVSSFFSNKSEKLYSDWIQRESNKIDQDEPVAISDSIQLEYTILKRQNYSVSKIVDIPSNMRMKYI